MDTFSAHLLVMRGLGNATIYNKQKITAKVLREIGTLTRRCFTSTPGKSVSGRNFICMYRLICRVRLNEKSLATN
jgi:hypothetical protein